MFRPAPLSVLIKLAATTPTGQWLGRGYEDWEPTALEDMHYSDEELSEVPTSCRGAATLPHPAMVRRIHWP